MPNYLIAISYDGTDFHGWQSQPNDRNVQDTLESAIAKLFVNGIRATAAGRTDAGVHAIALPVSFSTEMRRPCDTVVKALNALLPDDVRVRSCRYAPDGFSARFNAESRTYRYIIECAETPDPVTRRYAWQLPVEIDKESVQYALSVLLGEHDFSSFRAAGCTADSPIRTMRRTALEILGEGRYALVFEANGFLRQMVRSIVGTLIEIGRRERPPEDMVKLISSPDREGAGVTAPPHGLYFVSARYREFDG